MIETIGLLLHVFSATSLHDTSAKRNYSGIAIDSKKEKGNLRVFSLFFHQKQAKNEKRSVLT
jgi:hypothetical protein